MSLLSAGVAVHAADDTSVYGTRSVVFEPTRSASLSRGCSLAYRAAFPDEERTRGAVAVIFGDITVYQDGVKGLLSLKIGVMELDTLYPKQSVPHFAYLQTEQATTARRASNSAVVDGYRSIAFPIGDTEVDILNEMLTSRKVTIGMHRVKDGAAVRVPLDLTVYDAEFLSSQRVIRARSDEAVLRFGACIKQFVALREPRK